MTFASVAVFDKKGALSYSDPHRERSGDLAQARKAATRYWGGRAEVRKSSLKTIYLVRSINSKLIEIHERDAGKRAADEPWTSWRVQTAEAGQVPRAAAAILSAIAELGVAIDAEPAMPSVLEINGLIYKLDI